MQDFRNLQIDVYCGKLSVSKFLIDVLLALSLEAWQARGRFFERFMKDLILRINFDPQILPSYKQFKMSIQRAILDIHIMMLLEELPRSKLFTIR